VQKEALIYKNLPVNRSVINKNLFSQPNLLLTSMPSCSCSAALVVPLCGSAARGQCELPGNSAAQRHKGGWRALQRSRGEQKGFHNLVYSNIGKLIIDLIEINIAKVLIGTMPNNNHILNARNTLINMLNTLYSIGYSEDLMNYITSYTQPFNISVNIAAPTLMETLPPLDKTNIIFIFILETIKIEFKLSAKSINNKLVADKSNS
jgi:hypothetical protein